MQAVQVVQEPADAEAVAERAAPQRDRPLPHATQFRGGQHAVAVAELEARPAEQVAHRGGQAAAGVVGTGALPEGSPGPGGSQFAVVAAVVAHGVRADHHLGQSVHGVRQAHRLQDERGHGLLERQARDLLDDAAGQVVSGLAVRGPGPGRCDQRQRGQPPHEPGQGAVALAVVDQVPVEARGVVEQVEDGDPLRGPLVGQPQFGHVAPYGGVQVHLPLGDQTHQGGRREGLGHRRQREQRLLVDRQRVAEVGHAVRGVALLTVQEHPDGDTWNAELHGLCGDEIRQLLLRHGSPSGYLN